MMQVFWMHPYRDAREPQQHQELCLSEAEHLREHRDLLFPSTRAAWCMVGSAVEHQWEEAYVPFSTHLFLLYIFLCLLVRSTQAYLGLGEGGSASGVIELERTASRCEMYCAA